MRSTAEWMKSGAPWIWLNAGAVAASLIMVLGLLGLIAYKGLGHFWPARVWAFQYHNADGSEVRLLGEIRDQELINAARLRDAGEQVPEDAGEEVTRYLVK
ncbi:MAG TPA: phosphate ABC transporter, permease protein PstA, partial [Gammaproteobacteria bacterium]|nr:phosphate ABC transporter, permease protein PstA [Gammaproteobacteria bacterium]